MKELKALIARLAAEQIYLKDKRKTGPYTVKFNSWGWPESYSIDMKPHWDAAEKVRQNKAMITAALNYCHELRGSDYRHNIPDDDWIYCKRYREAMEVLREKYPSIEGAL